MHSKASPRRRHSAELKTKVLKACGEPGASISAVALAYGLNATLVRKWLVGRGLKRAGLEAPLAVMAPVRASKLAPAASPMVAANARFLALEMGPAQATLAEPARHGDIAGIAHEPIHVELHRGALKLSVRWPTVAGGDCAAWLRELSIGLLK